MGHRSDQRPLYTGGGGLPAGIWLSRPHLAPGGGHQRGTQDARASDLPSRPPSGGGERRASPPAEVPLLPSRPTPGGGGPPETAAALPQADGDRAESYGTSANHRPYVRDDGP